MSKIDYILRSLSKTTHKRWEHYVITRIYHQLSDDDIEFVCQQCVRKSDGKIYLADLFFPQLGLYLEIDEQHHNGDEAKKKDAQRRFDIAEAAGLREYRIIAFDVSLESINQAIEDFVSLVRAEISLRIAKGEFKPWDYENRFTADPHLEAGFIEVGPHAAFWTHRNALNCFGYDKGHLQKAVWNIPPHVSQYVGLAGRCMVWFPKLYKQGNWTNSLSDDGTIVIEKNDNPDHTYDEPWDNRIIMARSRDELNRTLYRFLGVFQVIPEFRSGNEHQFRRVATRVKTYRG
jgi:very-short-patch-repair endonuclease